MNVYVREVSRNLGRTGVPVDLFTRSHAGHCHGVTDLGDNVRLVHLEGGPETATPNELYPYLETFLKELSRHAQQEGARYRLVHSHYWLSGWIGNRVSSRWRVPHVVTFHTLGDVKMQAKAGEGESYERGATERELASKAHLIIASSPHEEDALVHLYDADRSRIEVVPCGVDLSIFKPLDIDEARRRLGLNGERVVLYVGRLEAIKGVDLLLHSAAIMEGKDSLKVLVVGGDATRGGEVRRLKGLAEELGIGQVMEFVGMVDQSLLPLYYNAADVCVVPSYYESFGLVALEALACGTPVVASRVGGLPTVVQHARTGYLQSWRCPEPFADSLEVILGSKGLRNSMSREARKRAEGMGWEMVAEETSRLYDSL
jgi:D-inositol-3-phosphate glycosyltransferase